MRSDRPHHVIGMTLIELLVVIAVVSMLVAILLPTLGYMRTLSKREACKSNLRQIGIAWHMYLDENDGKFLQAPNADTSFAGWAGSDADLQGYARPLNVHLSLTPVVASESGAQVCRCPADDGRVISQDGLSMYTYYGISYRMNNLLVGDSFICNLPSKKLEEEINRRLKNLTVNEVANHSRLALVGDFDWVDQWWPETDPVEGWHGKSFCFNIAYLDGHVSFLWIRKGLYDTNQYTVLPFKDLYRLAREVQKEEECR